MLKFLRTLFLIFCLVLTALVGVAGYLYTEAKNFVNPNAQVVLIKKGSSVKKIAAQLAQQKVVRHAWDFEIYARYTQISGLLKAGEYEFTKGLSLIQVVEQMVQGKVKQYKFTIPEGRNLRDVCQILVDQKLMSLTECEIQVLRVDLLKGVSGVKNLEGFLFPETYLYERDATPDQIFEQMVAMFYQKVDQTRIDKAAALGFSLKELVTFASLVEKETGVPEERPLIAGVFHNRLRIGMLLQTDPAVIYGIQNFDGNIRRVDLTRDTPYNTYTRAGLPVGPISNPGLDAIDAVLNPTNTDNLYFVAKGAGSHYFSKTLSQHNQAVQYYQLKRGPEPPQ